MSIWNKLTAGFMYLCFGFEAATDYVLKLLNKFFGSGNIPEKIQEARAKIGKCLFYLRKYQKYCPVVWAPDYEKLLVAVETLDDAFADNQLNQGEVDKAIAAFKAAFEEWMKD